MGELLSRSDCRMIDRNTLHPSGTEEYFLFAILEK